MSLRRFGRLFQTRNERYAADISASVAGRLGWQTSPGDDVSATFTGRASDGSEFTIRAFLFDDDEGTNDSVEWRAGPPRLDALLLAMTNDNDGDRAWLRHVQVPGGLAHDDPNPQELREALNARAAEDLSPRELNDYALQLGAGGSDGVILRFERSAVEVDLNVALPVYGKRLQLLAASPEVVAHIITESVHEQLLAVLAGASTRLGATFEAFVGLPFAKMWIETRWTSVEQVQAIVELGASLRGRALSY